LSFPVNGQYNFTVDDAEGCTPMKVKFTFTNTSGVDTIDSFLWNFGDGMTSTQDDTITHIYTIPNTYTPELIYNSRFDSIIVKPDLIKVHRTVPADFTYINQGAYSFYILEQTGLLDAGVTYNFDWDIEEFTPRSGARQEVNFPRPDTFTVTLTLSDEFGCTSDTTISIAVLEEITVQNVFTPDGNGINDKFMVISNGGFPIRVRVFSRAGVLVFEGEGYKVTWYGQTASGEYFNPGVYYYSIEALGADPDMRYSKAGFFYLFR
jgi:PKD repeat protein